MEQAKSMLQSMAHNQIEMLHDNTSRRGYTRPTHACSKDAAFTDNRHQETRYAGDATAGTVSPRATLQSPSGQKTLYKLLDYEKGLFCQGGTWPCAWDAVGRTWSSKSALRRYLRSVLARGYHLKPRTVPLHWRIVEIEQVVSYHEKGRFSAALLIASQ